MVIAGRPEGKTAIITGGGTGIGFAVTEAFVAEGTVADSNGAAVTHWGALGVTI